MAAPADFSYSPEPEPHKARTKAILAKHPEVRDLIGRTPMSFFLILAVVVVQILIAWLLFFFPVFQALRPPRLKNIPFMSGWVILNWIVVFGFDAAVLVLLGPTAFLYFVFSFAFAIGLHPLGARWIQEHYLTYPPQETYSYYGILNTVALNVGYHNEHHDFPSVPWNRLPQLKATAPEFYNTLHSHTSWGKLLLRFLFDPTLSLYSRMVRAR